MLQELLKTLYSSESLELYENEDMTLPLVKINKITKISKRDKSDHYTSRLLSWFRFAGIIERRIEQDENSPLLIPTNHLGKEKGKLKKPENIEDVIQLELLF